MQFNDLPVTGPWGERHLLGLETLSRDQLTTILDLADYLREQTENGTRRLELLRGLVVANLFFENSTRTRTSFSLAARRLGADTVDFTASSSSLSKGETFIDTARTIEAMGVDMVTGRAAQIPDQVLAPIELQKSPGCVGREPAQGRLQLVQGNAQVRHACRVGLNLELTHFPANGDDLCDTRYGQETRAEYPVGVLTYGHG